MMPAMAVPQCLYFGPFAIDCNQRRLVRGGTTVQLTPKAFDLLLILLESAGRTVTVDRLMNALWPDNEEANDATLRQHVLMVRRAFGDRIRDPRYVVTDYGKGYRFVGAVSPGPSFLTQTLVEELCAAAGEFRRSRSGTALRSALDLYHRALTIDGANAAALGGAALCRCLIADNLCDLPKPLLEIAHEQSNSALSVDPDCVDALLARAKVRLHGDGDAGSALTLAERAIALAPDDRVALELKAWILILQARFAQAHAFLDERAVSPGVSNPFAHTGVQRFSTRATTLPRSPTCRMRAPTALTRRSRAPRSDRRSFSPATCRGHCLSSTRFGFPSPIRSPKANSIRDS